MSTLAADFLKHGTERFKDTEDPTLRGLQSWTHVFIRNRLLAPLPGPGLRQSADWSAEKYVFSEDAPDIVRGLVASGAVDDRLVWESMRLPATNFWIEYPIKNHDLTQVGMMIGSVAMSDSVLASQRVMLAIVGKTDRDRVAACALMSLPEVRLVPGQSHVHLHWFLDRLAKGPNKNQDEEHDAKMFVHDLVDCLFLINTPRVSELRTGAFGKRKVKKIEDRDTLPLVEYRRIVVKIGVGQPKYPKSTSVDPASTESVDARHRRLHRVVGHFRTYREGRNQPKVSFVPQYWRGDAGLGVLLHEREMKR